MKRITVFIFTILLLTFTLGFGSCEKKPLPNTDGADWTGLNPTGRFAKTDHGVNVEASTPIDQELLPLIEAGLTDLFQIADAQYSGYTKELTRWHVWLMPPSPKCSQPAFTVRNDLSPRYPAGWDQAPDIDKDPAEGKVLLCVAGFMSRSGNALEYPGMVIVADRGSARLATRYEGEHNILYEVDREKFDQTQNNHSHPLISRADGSQWLVIPGSFDRRAASVDLNRIYVLPHSWDAIYGDMKVHILLTN